MGVLEDLCDEEISWGDFWKLDGKCSLSMFGAVLPFLYSAGLSLAILVQWLHWRKTSSRRGKGLVGKDQSLNAFMNGEGGVEETKGDDDALAPLLPDGYDSGPDGVEPETVMKKGTGLHWWKLILYGLQFSYHAGVGVYDLVDGHADDPYKYASQVILASAWVLHCLTETMHHQLEHRRRNPLPQPVFPALAFAMELWEVLQFDGAGHVSPKELVAWDLGLLLLVVVFDIWSCIRRVPVKYYRYLNEEYTAGFWSYFNFNYYTRVINVAYRSELKVDDLPPLIDDDRSGKVWARFTRLLYPRGPENMLDGEKLYIGTNIVRLGGRRYFYQATVAFLSAISQLIPPLALNSITDYMETYDPDEGGGVPLIVIICVAGLFFGQVFANYCDLTMFRLGRRLGIRARSALVSAVFRKAMMLDMSSANAGQLQNLISVDTESVLNLMVFQMFMWGALLRLAACVVLLFWVLGISAISGLSLVFLTLPLNKVLVGRLKTFQLALMKRRDDRMSVVNEAMQGVRIIKLFAWEPNFLAKIIDARRLELLLLRSYMFTLGCFMVAVKSSPTLIGLVTFIVHTKGFGYELTAATGFTALALFNQLRMPLIVLPDAFNYYIQARVSFKRIEKFLQRTGDEVRSRDGYGVDGGSDRHCSHLARGEARIEDGTFRWRLSSPSDPPTLKDVSLHIKPGQLVCVYGPTGAGKSSLLMAFLQELVTVRGRSLLNGTVAYASQRAWIQNATVRDNILFGCPFDQRRYDKTLEACALKSDLELLEAGDMTEIGEKGVNLSGGQQQRVSLARAVYADSDVLLLDDVLSAVDAHVGKHLFDKCIRQALNGKTRVLVTHQVSLTARYADQIIVLNMDGSVREQGTYDDLTKSAEGGLTQVIEAAGTAPAALLRRASSNVSGGGDDRDVKEPEKPAQATAKIIEMEKRAVGRPKPKLFVSYFKSCGGVWFGVSWALLSCAWQGLTVGQSFCLRTWIDDMSAGASSSNQSMLYYIGVSLASFLTLLVRTILITSGSLRASRVVHNRMAARIFRAPVGWYDATPLGRIFNRFSSDIVTLDKDLMNDLSGYTDMLLGVLGVVIVIAIAIPVLTVAMVPILALCYYYSERYLQTSRQLKRLEAVKRSPLFAHFSESINGVCTIRAFEAGNRFIEESADRVDTLNRSHIYLWISNYWLTNRVRIIGSLVCGLAGAFLVGSVGGIDGSTGGLVITYALNFTLNVVFTVRLHAQMEMSVNSIERLDEYCELPQEAPRVIEDRRPPGSWPNAGEVSVNNMSLQYASSSEPVLHGLSFHVPGGTRVGIVGRTGAGKSSLMTALFRIVEPLPGSSVTIDGVNILEIGLDDLRRRLAIIPQEPTLFEGTVRSNVDPFEEYSDVQVWEALRQCSLHDFISAMDDKLQYKVAATGANLSVGQRQLMCMARALLRRAAVLVMDEATANVDPETDAAIQDTIKEGFGDCTILCIAHRLHTVVYYDRILVLDKGRVVEYDTPARLLREKGGTFRGMCEKTGDLDKLVRIAKETEAASARRTTAAIK